MKVLAFLRFLRPTTPIPSHLSNPTLSPISLLSQSHRLQRPTDPPCPGPELLWLVVSLAFLSLLLCC